MTAKKITKVNESGVIVREEINTNRFDVFGLSLDLKQSLFALASAFLMLGINGSKNEDVFFCVIICKAFSLNFVIQFILRNYCFVAL